MSKISKHLNQSYDSLGSRQRHKIKPLMDGQVLQANEDGFTDVCTCSEAARLAGISVCQMNRFVQSGRVRRVYLPGRTYAIGVNIEDVRKLIIDIGTTVDVSTAARRIGCDYRTASRLVGSGRLAAVKVEGCQRRRVTIESVNREIEFRGGRSGHEVAAAVRRDESKNRPADEVIEALAAGLRKQLEERRALREKGG